MEDARAADTSTCTVPMERAQHRLNALLIAVAASLGVLIGVVGAARREPGRVAPRSWVVEPLAEDAHPLLAPASAPSLAPAEGADAPAPARAQESLPPPARVLGFVFLADGAPAAGASVRLGDQEERADDTGHFELRVPSADGPLDLVAFLSGHEPSLVPAFVSGSERGAIHEARLMLGPPTLTLTGHVLDERGHPLKHWTVELDGQDTLTRLGLRERVRTDAEGAFVLADVPAGVHVVHAWKDERTASYPSEPVQAGSTGVVVSVPGTDG